MSPYIYCDVQTILHNVQPTDFLWRIRVAPKHFLAVQRWHNLVGERIFLKFVKGLVKGVIPLDKAISLSIMFLQWGIYTRQALMKCLKSFRSPISLGDSGLQVGFIESPTVIFQTSRTLPPFCLTWSPKTKRYIFQFFPFSFSSNQSFFYDHEQAMLKCWKCN